MAYKRRYLAGQLAVTVDIAQQAITTDKIGDGAVGGTQLKDDSVSTDKIVDGDVKAVDLGVQAVETAKIKDGAVTTVKLADEAVTSDKLSPEVASSVRPLTPGVSSAEIADAAVIAAKLGAEAVETAKIKDGAVSTAKIAADAVDNTKIADNAVDSEQIVASAVKTAELDNLSVSEGKIINGSVTNTKIADGAVYGDKIPNGGVGQDKIAADAVQTLQIEDEAVTAAKLNTAALAKRHLSSKRARMIDLHEEFIGGIMANGWSTLIAAGGGINSDGLNGLSLLTGALANDNIVISNDLVCNILETLPVFDAIVLNQQLTERDTFFGVEDGAGNRVGFECSAGVGGANWFARCDYADGVALVDTTVASIISSKDIFSFEVVDATTVKFYIDGILVATIVSTVPAATPVFPVIDFETTEAVAKEMNIRLYSLLADRV